MAEIPQSIWNQDEKGEWKLYFNIQSELPSSQMKKEEQKHKKNINLNTSEKNLILGNLVMTPKGIGRVIKSMEGKAHIKFNQDIKEYEYSISEISKFLMCYIIYMSKEINDVIRLKLKVDGKVENIFEELIKIKKINAENINNYSLLHNKIKLKPENTFEQLQFMNNAKILILENKNIEKKVCRYSILNEYWYSYNKDGITFSVSKNINLIGVGMYRPRNNNVTIKGNLKLIEGIYFKDKVISETYAEIKSSPVDNNPIIKVKFQKPVNIKKNVDYTIIFITSITTETFNGSGGKNTIEGENDIIFTFKNMKEYRGTTVEAGNFPELYYS